MTSADRFVRVVGVGYARASTVRGEEPMPSKRIEKFAIHRRAHMKLAEDKRLAKQHDQLMRRVPTRTIWPPARATTPTEFARQRQPWR